MQKHNHIKALFFLGIFSLLLLHQVVPHWHHQHEIEHSHEAIANSDNHGHHHDVPEKENYKKGLLDIFLEVHNHTVASYEVLVAQENSVKQLKVNKDARQPIWFNHYSNPIVYDDVEKIRVYHPSNNYFNSYLSSLSTRGPPSLG